MKFILHNSPFLLCLKEERGTEQRKDADRVLVK
jgi:hypothetical protein